MRFCVKIIEFNTPVAAFIPFPFIKLSKSALMKKTCHLKVAWMDNNPVLLHHLLCSDLFPSPHHSVPCLYVETNLYYPRLHLRHAGLN